MEQGAEVHFRKRGTFEWKWGRGVVQSWIDFTVTSLDSGRTDEDADWLLSDHSSLGRSMVIGELRGTNSRKVVDWDGLVATLVDEDEGWYRDLVGETAYDKLLDLRWKHLKRLKVGGKSKRWWNGEIAAQLAVVRDYRRRYGRNGEWVKERYKLCSLVRDGKRKC